MSVKSDASGRRVRRREVLPNSEELLEPRWRTFIDQYVSNGFKVSAAKKAAGLSRSAPVPPLVREVLNQRMAAAFNQSRISSERVVHELATIAFANVTDYRDKKGNIDIDALPPEVTAAIKEMKVELSGKSKVVTDIKLHDKLAALSKLGDMLKLFPQQHEHTGPGGGPIQVDVRTRARELAERITTLAEQPDGTYAES